MFHEFNQKYLSNLSHSKLTTMHFNFLGISDKSSVAAHLFLQQQKYFHLDSNYICFCSNGEPPLCRYYCVVGLDEPMQM